MANGKKKRCSQEGRAIAIGGPECAGDLMESRRYFVDGSSAWMCEKHAKAMMAVNPFGPQYRMPEKTAGKECGLHFAHGLVEAWCTRPKGHAGSCRQDHPVRRTCSTATATK